MVFLYIRTSDSLPPLNPMRLIYLIVCHFEIVFSFYVFSLLWAEYATWTNKKK